MRAANAPAAPPRASSISRCSSLISTPEAAEGPPGHAKKCTSPHPPYLLISDLLREDRSRDLSHILAQRALHLVGTGVRRWRAMNRAFGFLFLICSSLGSAPA